ncbi:MAG: mechanosensitive ion channel [Anaerolineales bacterium]|nr:mechanosensitive ion channel [Anaerolineales bacterium]
MMKDFFAMLVEKFAASIPNFFAALLILVISYYGGVLLSRLLKRVLERQNAELGVTHLLSRVLKWSIISLGVIAALQRFFNVTAFLTGLGIIGFTVAFALQNIMQNFVSGVILLVQRPFKVGDTAGIAGYDGTVLKVGLRTTEIKTFDGRIVFLPNADVLSKPIINYTRATLRRVDLAIGVGYASDPENVRTVILNELKYVAGYVDTPEPLVLFHTFADSSINLDLFFWVDTTITSHVAAKDMTLTRIKQAFEKNNIEIPYPIQVQVLRVPEVRTKTRKTKPRKSR